MNLHNKIKGATIIEVVVASIITTLSIAMGLMIFFQIMKSNQISKKVQAKIVIANLIIDQRLKNNHQAAQFETNSIRVVKDVTDHPEYKSCKILQLTAFDASERILVTHKEIVHSYSFN